MVFDRSGPCSIQTLEGVVLEAGGSIEIAALVVARRRRARADDDDDDDDFSSAWRKDTLALVVLCFAHIPPPSKPKASYSIDRLPWDRSKACALLCLAWFVCGGAHECRLPSQLLASNNDRRD